MAKSMKPGLFVEKKAINGWILARFLSQIEMQGCLRLNVVIRKYFLITHLSAFINQTLLVGRDTFFIRNFGLYVGYWIGWLNI